MKVIKAFIDDYGNRATIDYSIRPFYKGGKPSPHYRCGINIYIMLQYMKA